MGRIRYEPEIIVPIAALNHYYYCPRRCYYMFVSHEFVDNVHTIEGRIVHARADSGSKTRRKELLQIRSVRLHSRKYGLVGIADLIEEKADEIYPVEYKKGKRGDWRNDELQLCAQALCIEENLNRTVTHGYIYYAQTGRRKRVNLTSEIRNMTIETIESVRNLILSAERPESKYTPRCKGCSLYPVCLPKEVEKIKCRLFI